MIIITLKNGENPNYFIFVSNINKHGKLTTKSQLLE